MSIFDKILRPKRETKNIGIPKLVIGINQVDNLGEWDKDINQPTRETEEKIKARAEDIIEKLTSGNHGASREQIEYFSALRAYRLPQVINKIIHCTGVITTFKPKEITDPACSEGMPEENREAINEMIAARRAKTKTLGLDSFIEELMSKLDASQSAELQKVIKEKKEKPINVAIIGQSGVGKSTTVNHLFGATERVSRTVEGTNVENFKGYKEYVLDDGSIMRVADLPGYGRSLENVGDEKKDLKDYMQEEKYKTIYINELKKCDVILLIIQANDKSIADDQFMIECLYEWSKEGLLVNDGTYYGQDTGLEEDFTVKEEVNDNRSNSTAEVIAASEEKAPVDYIRQIEEICEDAMRTLERDSEEYRKVKAILKML